MWKEAALSKNSQGDSWVGKEFTEEEEEEQQQQQDETRKKRGGKELGAEKAVGINNRNQSGKKRGKSATDTQTEESYGSPYSKRGQREREVGKLETTNYKEGEGALPASSPPPRSPPSDKRYVCFFFFSFFFFI